MSDLYPTPTRLRLLRAVSLGEVFRDHRDDDWLVYGDPVADKVTARIEEMRSAGWCELVATPARQWAGKWQLTDTGQAVLDAAKERAG